jgi:hypothetical protein
MDTAPATSEHPAAPSRAVVCVDGVVGSIWKPFTPDIGWSNYVRWLTRRRPDLAVAHLAQPHDWHEILAGRTEGYYGMVRSMLHELLAQHPAGWQEVVVLGYSLGGLTALSVAHEFSLRVSGSPNLDYLAFVTFGTPFGGTYALHDLLFKRMPINFLERIYARNETLEYLRELVRGDSPVRLRLLPHALRGDELVSSESATLPVEWLEFAAPENDVAWEAFELDLGRVGFPGPHGAFPQHPVALSYVDGIVDGLLPPDKPLPSYEPYELLPLPPAEPELEPPPSAEPPPAERPAEEPDGNLPAMDLTVSS